MKIVTALFHPDNTIGAVRRLTEKGFTYDDLSMMSSISEMPAFLEGEPEETAPTGAIVGAATGGAVGALGTVAASSIPGFEAVFVSGLMATAVGSVIGGYLGSLYSVRAETQTELDIHEALASGQVLIVVRCSDERQAKTAVTILENNNGEHVETHTIPQTEVQESMNS